MIPSFEKKIIFAYYMRCSVCKVLTVSMHQNLITCINIIHSDTFVIILKGLGME